MNFKKIRKDFKLTQIKAAIKVDVSLSTWRMWEAGVTTPNKSNMEKLKKIFDIEQED